MLFQNKKIIYTENFSLHDLFIEYKRPWKLVTLLIGICFLLYGALEYNYSDWDLGVSFIMAILTYLLGPWALSLFINALINKPKYWIVHLFIFILIEIFVVDISYFLWHYFNGNIMLRYDNFIVSSCLYLFCSILWVYKGSLKELVNEFK